MTVYGGELNCKLNDIVGDENNPSAKISSRYDDQVIKIPGGK